MVETQSISSVSDKLSQCHRIFSSLDYTRDVVITGFDTPFEEYDENPSAVVLDELLKEPIKNVEIHPFKIPATYEAVVEKLPELRENCPDDVIHLASHNIKNTIYFQQKAYFDGYCREDMNGYVPEGNRIEFLEEDEDLKKLKPFVDFDYLVDEVTEKCGLDGKRFGGLKVEKSNDPGRFVGGYLYYLSIREGPVNTLFIHVPPFEGECTKEAVAGVIREVIRFLTRNDF
ncbi:hypothetical protein L3Y34_014013 [Caenorhabditis briggsae]|uniref:Uncharacterized protein n=1 Tax=Caenorhabditis briggsae TaxID=6238 RepID=A0AAE9IXH6_CAEBR|nr:hypothetical protein L3Y34_014013 [Caenorhabditis briggsae]